MNRAAGAGLLAFGLVAVAAAHPEAYLKLGASVDGATVGVRWPSASIRYFLTERGVPGVTPGDLRSAVGLAVDSWEQVPSASVTFDFVGFTSAEPSDEDGLVTIGFQSRPDLEGVLASTSFVVDEITGEIVESDIVINSAFPWTVDESGAPGRFDLESVVLHELGHLIGLGHSLLGETEIAAGQRRVIAAESAMFPIAFGPGIVEGRVLHPDDVAGVSDVYPGPGFETRHGSVDGRVVKNGAGLFGAHVVAFNTRSGALVGGFALDDDGHFAIAGLEPGPYLLRVEPLDDAPVDGFFDDSSPPDVDFGVTYYERVVFVPAGGTVGGLVIQVRSP